MTLMVDEFMELLGTRDEVDQLGEVLVRGCGCGCTYRERELVSRNPDCWAVRGLRDRRFVLGPAVRSTTAASTGVGGMAAGVGAQRS